MKETQKILVVDDDREIVKVLSKLLELEGYEVYGAYDGMEALEVLTRSQIHLILLDVMMPKLDGLSTLMEVRKRQNIPVMILSAQTAELMARVRSLLRRYMTLGDVKRQQEDNSLLKTGGLVLDIKGRTLFVDGEKVRLTATEYKITEFLMQHMGQVFSAEEIYARVWNEDAFAVENTVMVHIRRIREKIEIDTKNPKYLKVVWGIGYKMEKI